MPFAETDGKVIKSPEQIELTIAKFGVIFGFTIIVLVKLLAHKPAVGVKL